MTATLIETLSAGQQAETLLSRDTARQAMLAGQFEAQRRTGAGTLTECVGVQARRIVHERMISPTRSRSTEKTVYSPVLAEPATTPADEGQDGERFDGLA
jgi:hypothetical protein